MNHKKEVWAIAKAKLRKSPELVLTKKEEISLPSLPMSPTATKITQTPAPERLNKISRFGRDDSQMKLLAL